MNIRQINRGLIMILVALLLVNSIGCIRQNESKRMKRQTGSESTALATSSSSSAMVTLSNLVLPTIRAIIQAPVKMLQELMMEFREFMSTHNFSEMLDTTFIRALLQRLPERIGKYWVSFLELESECIQRTLCDLADFTTHHVPQWVRQIMLIYFTTFNQNIYFEAINNGLIAHNCQAKFTQCDPNSFLSRISNNMSQSLHTTVEPIRVAFNELINVTVSTLDSIGATTESSQPLVPGIDEADEDDDETSFNERSKITPIAINAENGKTLNSSIVGEKLSSIPKMSNDTQLIQPTALESIPPANSNKHYPPAIQPMLPVTGPQQPMVNNPPYPQTMANHPQGPPSPVHHQLMPNSQQQPPAIGFKYYPYSK